MRISIRTLAVVAMLAAVPAFAESSPQAESLGPMHGPMMGEGMALGMMDPTQHLEGRLAFLKTELKITDTQTPQWNAFADAVRANAKRMSELRRTMISNDMMGQGMMMGPGKMMSSRAGLALSLPERLDRAERHMMVHLEMLRAMKGSTKELYAVLSGNQKRLADQLIHGPMGVGMMGMM